MVKRTFPDVRFPRDDGGDALGDRPPRLVGCEQGIDPRENIAQFFRRLFVREFSEVLFGIIDAGED